MKTMKVLVMAAGLLLTSAFMHAALANGNNNAVAVEEEVCEETSDAAAGEDLARCKGSVTNAQVIQYLAGYGYTVYQVICDDTCNRIADTQYSYNTYVYTNCAIITGHEDM